jgi:MoxR-like ATPase
MKNCSKIRLGSLEVTRRKTVNPNRVPKHYGQYVEDKWFQDHISWLFQKDVLNQDIFLIGPPGAIRRQLALSYCELTNREYEIVSLSRETTDSDLKQRREIVGGGTAIYVDQPPVKAALNGSVLILDGIEKAERNVLPILNNLLENREMGLSDGRFLVAADRYDKLLDGTLSSETSNSGLERVHPDFQIIALGLPIPTFPGFPLDPPLRSRFQARYVSNPPPLEQLRSLARRRHARTAQKETFSVLSKKTEPLSDVSSFIALSETIESFRNDDGPLASKSILHVPYETIANASKYMELFPEMPAHEALTISGWPYNLFDIDTSQSAVLDTAIRQIFDLTTKSPYTFSTAIKSSEEDDVTHLIFLNNNSKDQSYGLTCRNDNQTVPVLIDAAQIDNLLLPKNANNTNNLKNTFTKVPEIEKALTELMQGYALNRDLCVVGLAGSGKTRLVDFFCKELKHKSTLVNCYRDMSARDLLLKRTTDDNGSTTWEMSPLLNGALNGEIVILDGIHRLEPDTLAVLHSLLTHREIDLADGRRLLRHDRFDNVQKLHCNNKPIESPNDILRVHPSFRVVALANTPSRNGDGNEDWINSEVLTMFHFVSLPKPSKQSVVNILENVTNSNSASNDEERMLKLVRVSEQLETVHDVKNTGNVLADTAGVGSSKSTSMSLRQLKRIWQSSRGLNDFQVGDLIQRNLLTKFLPSVHRDAISEILAENGFLPKEASTQDKNISDAVKTISKITMDKTGNKAIIGSTEIAVNNETKFQHLIPNPLFFDIPAHVDYLESMVRDLKQDERWLLLIGNQGTGKNKLVDRLLYLLQWPREYMQLHRDTSIQSLTTVPTIEEGLIKYEDSPLVKAVQNGHVLIVDEADKAPTEVVCILKSLIEDGQMMLSDGRQLLSAEKIKDLDTSSCTSLSSIIEIHPNFKMMVLANRPGFPFLGNDFFREAGDCFSCYVIENSPRDSQVQLLKEYAKNEENKKLLVSPIILEKIVDVFADLHALYEDGTLLYPYSTREMVHIVKHMSQFPEHGISSAVSNVLDFDVCDQHILDILMDTFNIHGIPILLETGQSASLVTHENENSGMVSVQKLSPKINLSETQQLRYTKNNSGLKDGNLSIDFVNKMENIKIITSALETRNVGFQFDKQKPAVPTTLSKSSSVFSEEKQFFKLDIEDSKATCITSVGKNEVDILLSKPAGILRMNFNDGIGTFTDISSQYNHGINYGIGKYQNKWIFHALNEGVVITCQEDQSKSAKIAGMLSDSFFGKATSRVTWMDVRRRINENRLISSSIQSLQKYGVLYCYEGDKILQLDLSSDEAREVYSKELKLPFKVDQIFPIRRDDLVIKNGDDGSLYYTNFTAMESGESECASLYPVNFLLNKEEGGSKVLTEHAQIGADKFDIRSIHYFENDLIQEVDGRVIPKGSVYVNAVSKENGISTDFLVESFLNTGRKKNVSEEFEPGSMYEICNSQNSDLMNGDSKHVKTIFNGKKAVVVFEDPFYPFLKIIDFEKGTLQHVKLHDNFGDNVQDVTDGTVVDINFIQYDNNATLLNDACEAPMEEDVAVLYDDGTVRIIETNRELLMSELNNFKDMMGNVDENGIDNENLIETTNKFELIQVNELDSNEEDIFTLSSVDDELLF